MSMCPAHLVHFFSSLSDAVQRYHTIRLAVNQVRFAGEITQSQLKKVYTYAVCLSTNDHSGIHTTTAELHSVLMLTVILLLYITKAFHFLARLKYLVPGPSCCRADEHHHRAMNQGHGMDGCMFLNEYPTKMCWAKNEKNDKLKDME